MRRPTLNARHERKKNVSASNFFHVSKAVQCVHIVKRLISDLILLNSMTDRFVE